VENDRQEDVLDVGVVIFIRPNHSLIEQINCERHGSPSILKSGLSERLLNCSRAAVPFLEQNTFFAYFLDVKAT
jgi:hypothetical protein